MNTTTFFLGYHEDKDRRKVDGAQAVRKEEDIWRILAGERVVL
jgi:hypothetical protein